MSRFKRRTYHKNEPATRIARDHIGLALKSARLDSGKSLTDVARDLRIQDNYLAAIERLDQDALPSIGYVLGYVRAYARYLNLDAAHTVVAYKRDIACSNTVLTDQPHFVPKRTIRIPRGTYAIGTLLGCALVVFSWYGMRQPDARSADIVIPTQTSVPATEPAPVFAPIAESDSISLKAVGPSWVEIIDENGEIVVSRILVPGEIFTTDKSRRPVISARDGGALELYVGGKRIGLLGEQGQNLKEFSLIPAGE